MLLAHWLGFHSQINARTMNKQRNAGLTGRSTTRLCLLVCRCVNIFPNVLAVCVRAALIPIELSALALLCLSIWGITWRLEMWLSPVSEYWDFWKRTGLDFLRALRSWARGGAEEGCWQVENALSDSFLEPGGRPRPRFLWDLLQECAHTPGTCQQQQIRVCLCLCVLEWALRKVRSTRAAQAWCNCHGCKAGSVSWHAHLDVLCEKVGSPHSSHTVKEGFLAIFLIILILPAPSLCPGKVPFPHICENH